MKIKEQLDAALSEVTAAEEALASVLSELRSGVRAEKVAITATVEDAFTRLRKGRSELSKLRESVEDE